MKRAERHHLKQDEFVHWLDRAIFWIQTNKKQLVNGILVIAGAGLLMTGLYVYRGRQTETAQVLLSNALEQYHGVVLLPAAPPPPAGIATFDSNEAKFGAALTSFENLANNYGSYDAGRQGRYYAALCQIALDQHEAARTSLEEVRQGAHDLLYYLASRSLAEVEGEAGDRQTASEIYRRMIEDGDNPLPKDHLLFDLARNEERAGNVDEARGYYARMLSEHPNSQLRGDAMNRRDTLELASQGGAESSD